MTQHAADLELLASTTARDRRCAAAFGKRMLEDAMNPITMVGQEFAPMVVEEWSDAAALCRQEQGADESHVVIAAARSGNWN